MQKNRSKRGKERLAALKEILSHLPQENTEIKVILFPRVELALRELSQNGYVWISFISYSQQRKIINPTFKTVKKYGVNIQVEPVYDIYGWDWELIKKALTKIGFCYCGQGQRDWYLNLYP